MVLRISLFLMVMFALVACNRDNFSAERNPAGGVDITVIATEAEINVMLANALAQGSGAVRNASIDLQPAQMLVTGEVEQQDGSGNFVPATFTITVTVVDGQLSAQIINLNVAGWSATDDRVSQIN